MKKITIGGIVLFLLGSLYTTIIEPAIKTYVTEKVKVEITEDSEEAIVDKVETVVKDSSLETEENSANPNNQDDNIEVDSEAFNLANKYIIQTGEFSKESGAYKRLNEVRIVYPDAYIEAFEKQRDNEKKIHYRVIVEKGESLSVSEIYNKSIEYHNNLLNVISDKIGVGEKLAAPLIENEYLQSKLESIEKYTYQKDFENAKKYIKSVLNTVDMNTIAGYNGYITYKDEIKKILERKENNVLKLGISDIYNNL